MKQPKPTTHSPQLNKKSKPKILTVSLSRAPVVAVLGHVDHGKTTLLDSIRKTNIQASETGGITQHIGAYQVIHKGQSITFIDTPGHAAFAKMRQRGAEATDIVVLVVAANDGVKPQTKESLRHIQAAGVPFLVAINKMDLPGANADTIKAQLAQQNVIVESYGGEVVCVETVAKSGQGVSELLDMILLLCQMKGLTGTAAEPLEAVVIESKMQKSRGPVASVVVKGGTLRPGDQIQVGELRAKVRALFDANGQTLSAVKPGEPAEILGFGELPQVGERVTRVGEPQSKPTSVPPVPPAKSDLAPAGQVPAGNLAGESVPSLTQKSIQDTSLKEEEATTEEEAIDRPRIKAVLKADTQGTLEAIKTNVAEEVEQVGEGVGEVTESDVLLAQATGAKILAFRVPASKRIQKLAEVEQVEIKTYAAIYELLEDLETQVLKVLEPTIDEEVVGEANVIAEFNIKKDRIAGCKVISGKLDTGGTVHLLRGEKIVGSGRIRSLKQGRVDVTSVKPGEECGMTLRPALDFKVGDKLQYYRTLEN